LFSVSFTWYSRCICVKLTQPRSLTMNASVTPIPVRKLALLATLYASQGLPFGFFSQALPVLMRQQNYSLRWIGLSTLLALPWALKWLWAGVIDTVYYAPWGRRRGWILPLQLFNCLTLVAIALGGDSRDLKWLLIGTFFTNLFAATQDVATDGLAVEQLTASERGLGNGVQVAGYRLGMIAGGSLLLVWFDLMGWTIAMLTLAVVLAVLTLPTFAFREAPASAPHAHVGAVFTWFKRPRNTIWVGVLLVYKFGDALASGMFKPYLVDAGLSIARIGWIDGALGSAAGLLGAVAGGWWLGRVGYRHALGGFGLVSAMSTAMYAAASVSALPVWGYAALVTVEHFAGGMATVALFTAMMHFCRRDTEGADYTLQASLVVLSTGLAGAASGFLAERLGYSGLFTLGAILSVFGALAGARGFALAGNSSSGTATGPSGIAQKS
jgi:PAT family beta-lactamase induction signal transducer AmpG